MLSSALSIGLWNILFWVLIGIAIGGLISWLLGSSTATAADRGGVGLADLEGRSVRIREERTELADQLEAIEGVGPQIAELFHKHGVHRFAQVAAMSVADIERILTSGGANFGLARPFTWPFQARLLQHGWFAEFFRLREKMTAGRLPLIGITGLGASTAAHFSNGGIGSVEALADSNVEDAAAKLKGSGEIVPDSQVSAWIDEARAVVDGDFGRLAAFFGIPAAVLAARPAASYTERREVSGPLVDASALLGTTTASATAHAAPSLLPVWLGLGGAALLALLSGLGLWGPARPSVPAVATPDGVPAPAVSVMSAELGTDTTFVTSSADLTDAGKAEIDSKIIGPARDLDVTSVRIVGHADVRGDDTANLALSRDRAKSVAAYMREKVAAESIKWNPRVIEVYGAGEEFPNPNANTPVDCADLLANNPTSAEASACFAPDRRVDVIILARGERSQVEAAKASAE